MQLKHKILGYLASNILKTFGLTIKWELVGSTNEDLLPWLNTDPMIIAYWHGQQLAFPFNHITKKIKSFRGVRDLYSLSSNHGDGKNCCLCNE